ncbi:MAG: GAF domain-containing protein [Hormoscilla sp. GUM202]|nr:GAF domain-containing protein [Hormoscilla sp. GUM202]
MTGILFSRKSLTTSLLTMKQSVTVQMTIRAILIQTVQIANRLTDAEESSLFLLDANGIVIESILARGATIKEQKQSLIGQVLNKGLAGWVLGNRQVGLIADTMSDPRWVTLKNQPYTVRSALCVPIFQGKLLVGIITMMHSQPEHFTLSTSSIIQMIAAQIALVLDNTRLSMIQNQQPVQRVEKTESQGSSRNKLSVLGMYIIDRNGKFMYANPRLAEIFGYPFSALALKSILDFTTADRRWELADRIDLCLGSHNQNLSGRFPGERKDRSIINVEIYGTTTKFYGRPAIIGVLKSQSGVTSARYSSLSP